MYAIVSIAGSIIRQLFLPNPFTELFDTQGMAVGFNLLVGGSVIGCLSYILTGCIYDSGDNPAEGSALYTISYIVITFLFYGITELISNVILAVIIFIILYGVACIFLSNLKSRIL